MKRANRSDDVFNKEALERLLAEQLGGAPVVFQDPHLGIKGHFEFDGVGNLATVEVTCPCGEHAKFSDFKRKELRHALKFFHIREWINALTEENLHDIGRAWDAAFRYRGPGRMRAQESVRAALFQCAPEFSHEEEIP